MKEKFNDKKLFERLGKVLAGEMTHRPEIFTIKAEKQPEMTEFTYNLSFKIGDKVRYNNKLTGRDEGYVTNISIRQNGTAYGITWSDKHEQFHYDFELELIS